MKGSPKSSGMAKAKGKGRGKPKDTNPRGYKSKKG